MTEIDTNVKTYRIPATFNVYSNLKSLYQPSDPVIVEGYQKVNTNRVISPQHTNPKSIPPLYPRQGPVTPSRKERIPSPKTVSKPECDPIFDLPFSGNADRPYGAIPGILRSWSDLSKLDIIEYEWRNQFYRLYKTGNLKLVGNRLFQRIVLSRLHPSETDQWEYQYDFYTEVHNKKWNNFNGTYYLDTCDGLYEAGR